MTEVVEQDDSVTFVSAFIIINILKAKSNFTLLLYVPFLGIGEWYFKCV